MKLQCLPSGGSSTRDASWGSMNLQRGYAGHDDLDAQWVAYDSPHSAKKERPDVRASKQLRAPRRAALAGVTELLIGAV